MVSVLDEGTRATKMLILPGHDSKTGNTNSFLYRSFPDACTYSFDRDLTDSDATEAVVHSCGFFAFIVGRQNGLYANVNKLIVFDGWWPTDCMFNGKKYDIVIPDIPSVYFFPTVGDRTEYILEPLVGGHTIVRGKGFGHNMLYGSFDEAAARTLVAEMFADDVKSCTINRV